jgi:group I intron endonuclease
MYNIYLLTNKINGKKYVGFTTQAVGKRFSCHVSASKRNPESILHHAIRKYGAHNFILEVLETGLDKNVGLRIREPYFIQKFSPQYNMTRGGEGSFGYKPSEASNLKRSISLKGRKFTSEHREKLVQVAIGRKHSFQWCKNNGNGHAKWYEILSPSGVSFCIKNMRMFCREHKLHQGYMISIAKGKKKSYKGWSCKLIPHKEDQIAETFVT